MKLKLPYLVEEQAGGRTYHYVRKGKGPRVAITAQPGTAEFGRQYADALNALSHGQAQVSAPRFQWRHLVSAYLNSAAVQRLHPETRRVRRRVLEQFLHDWAAKDYRKLEALDVIEVLEQKARRPEAAITRLKAIRAVLNYAVRRELVATNVAPGSWSGTRRRVAAATRKTRLPCRSCRPCARLSTPRRPATWCTW